MVSLAYSEAAVEVLDILEHTRKEEVEKVPKKFIEFLKENASKTYVAKLDHTKKIAEMELKPKTKAILGLIYLKYWGDKQGKKAFTNRIKENEIKYQEVLREKYNPDNMFKKSAAIVEKKQEEIEQVQEIALTTIKEDTLIQKIIRKIKEVFRR